MSSPALPRRRLWPLAVATFCGVVILCALGLWQLQRMGEKNAFLARLAAQSLATPQQLPPSATWGSLDLAALDLMRVRLTGTWLSQASATVRVAMPEPQPASRGAVTGGLGGFGRYLVTAVRLDDGGIVLVNRGFAPEAIQASLPPPTGRADLIGFVRRPEIGNAFTPAPDTARRDFHVRDPRLMAPVLGIAAAPFMVEAERGSDAMTPPVGVEASALIARIPNNHLQYALTWFGLAATLLGVFAAVVVGQRAQNRNRS